MFNRATKKTTRTTSGALELSVPSGSGHYALPELWWINSHWHQSWEYLPERETPTQADGIVQEPCYVGPHRGVMLDIL